VAIAESTTRFGLTETRLGLIPATISPYVVARMGEGMARRVFMSSRLFDVDEAVQFGLIARHVPAGELEQAVENEVAPYLNVAPQAVGTAKRLARSLGPVIDDAVIEETVRQLVETWETEEAAHGLNAFLNKTKPRWAQDG
jgi:methylglutaconyl-CoA hydratase